MSTRLWAEYFFDALLSGHCARGYDECACQPASRFFASSANKSCKRTSSSCAWVLSAVVVAASSLSQISIKVFTFAIIRCCSASGGNGCKESCISLRFTCRAPIHLSNAISCRSEEGSDIAGLNHSGLTTRPGRNSITRCPRQQRNSAGTITVSPTLPSGANTTSSFCGVSLLFLSTQVSSDTNRSLSKRSPADLTEFVSRQAMPVAVNFGVEYGQSTISSQSSSAVNQAHDLSRSWGTVVFAADQASRRFELRLLGSPETFSVIKCPKYLQPVRLSDPAPPTSPDTQIQNGLPQYLDLVRQAGELV